MAADLILKTAEEQLTCPICYDLFEEPKALPCLHTFCRKCIDDHIARHAHTDTPPHGFRCPICRRFVTAPSGLERNSTNWAEHLEGNHVIVTLMDAYKTQRGTSCKTHSGKELEFYCFDHSIFICSMCALEHRRCDDVQTREDALPRLEAAMMDDVMPKDDEREALMSLTLEHCNEAERLIGERKSRILNLEQAEVDILQGMKELRSQINQILDDEEEKFKAKLARRKTKEIAKIETEIKKCEKIADRTKNVMEALQTIKPESSTSGYDSVRKNLESCKKKLHSARQKSLCNTMEFQRSETVDTLLQNIDTLGYIKVISGDGVNEERDELQATGGEDTQENGCHGNITDITIVRPKPAPRRRQPPSPSKDTQNASLSLRVTGNLIIKQAIGKPCWITGIAMLPNGDILLVNYHNEAVHLYDSHHNVLSQTHVKPSPYDVTSVSENEVLLTRPDAKDGVISYTVSDGFLKNGESFNVGVNGRSLNYKNGKLAICSHETLETFRKDGHYWLHVAKRKFEKTKFTYTVLDEQGEKVFVTNQQYPDPEVLCMSIFGEMIWRFGHPDLNFPSGIDTNGGAVFVASWDRNKIFQLTTTGSCLAITDAIGALYPWKLCINGDKIYVSQHKTALDAESKKSVKLLQME